MIMDQVIGSNRAVVCVLLFCFLVKGNTMGVGKESTKIVPLRTFLKVFCVHKSRLQRMLVGKYTVNLRAPRHS